MGAVEVEQELHNTTSEEFIDLTATNQQRDADTEQSRSAPMRIFLKVSNHSLLESKIYFLFSYVVATRHVQFSRFASVAAQ